MRPTRKRALTEHQIQDQIVSVLRACGLTVLHTTAYKQKGSSGVSKGVPDLLVYHSCTNCGISLGLEVKRPGEIRYSSPEQKRMADLGHVLIVQSPEDALAKTKLFLELVGQTRLGSEAVITKIESARADLAKGPRVSA